jgi:hypothetical protein
MVRLRSENLRFYTLSLNDQRIKLKVILSS